MHLSPAGPRSRGSEIYQVSEVFLYISAMVSFEEILPIEYTRELTLVKVAVLKLTDPRHCEKNLKLINKLYPSGDRFGHLKRIKSGDEGVLILLGDATCNFQVEGDIVFANVPESPAYTLAQFREWSKVWPLVYKRPPFDPASEIPKHHWENLRGLSPGECLLVAPDGRRFIGLADSHPLGHACMRAISATACSSTADDYLCSGFEVYVNREPCMMCGMALIHSRVSAVYFTDWRDSFGAFKNRLHCNSRLNHRYRAFRLVL